MGTAARGIRPEDPGRESAGAGSRGFALLLALAVLLIIAVVLAAVFRTALATKGSMQRERRLIELRAASDAALAETLAALEERSSFSGFGQHSFSGAVLSSSVRISGGGRREVVATAVKNGWSMTLTATIRIDRDGHVWIESWNRSPARPAGRGGVNRVG